MRPAVPGIVDNTRAAVSDACAHTMLVEFDDNKTRMMLHMTCDKTFTVGQRVSVVRNKAAGLDYRNLMIVQPVP